MRLCACATGMVIEINSELEWDILRMAATAQANRIGDDYEDTSYGVRFRLVRPARDRLFLPGGGGDVAHPSSRGNKAMNKYIVELIGMINAPDKGTASSQVGAVEQLPSEFGVIKRIYSAAASLDRVGMGLLRLGLVVVLVWIGGLKFAKYEADSIVPLVANSPLMSFFYHHPAPEYRPYMNREGELI